MEASWECLVIKFKKRIHMKKVLLISLFGWSILFANTVTLIDLSKSGKDWKAEVVINPPVVVDKTVVSNETNSSVVDFKTDVDTTVYFLIDTSVPMKKSFNKGIKPILSEMERVKLPKEKWIVSYFDNDLHVIYDDDNNKPEMVSDLLDKVPVKGQRTELWRNTQVALKDLASRTGTRKILVLFSDGDAEDTSAYTREDVIKMANDAHIRIVSLSYRDTIGTQNLRKISEDTNGAFWKADKITHKLPSDFQREMIKFVRSEGIVAIPSSLIHPTKTGKQDLNITFEHGTEKSLLAITVDTEKIVPPKPQPKIEPKPAAPIETKSDMQLFLEKYKLYLAGVGVLLLLVILYFLLRKKEEPEAAEPTISAQPVEMPEPPTMVAPAEPVAYFESLDGTRHEVYKFPSTIGKSATNDIVIPGQYISRQHATLIHKDGYFYITDNNSSNGVKVNGKKINMQERISNGVKVSFGPYETVFHTVGITSAEPLPNSNDEKTRLNR
jgi:hypothetical protein